MLVHICCSVDSHYFLTRLRADFPHEKIIGYFYNPNIHPKEEYDLRLADVKRSCKKLDIELLEGKYNDRDWFDLVKGKELEPEKCARCEICFDMRFLESAKMAKHLGCVKLTSTLLQSPLKNQNIVSNSAMLAANKYGLEFIFADYRSKGGMNEQNVAAKKEGLYRQNYCGCLYGLILQRAKQNKIPCELISDINGKALLGSAAKNKAAFEQAKILPTSQILNYIVLLGSIKANNNTVPSAILSYSKSSKQIWQDSAIFTDQDTMFFEKDNAKIITLALYNKLSKNSYTSLCELQNTSFLTDILVKSKLNSIDAVDFSPVFVTMELPDSLEIEFSLNATDFISKAIPAPINQTYENEDEK